MGLDMYAYSIDKKNVEMDENNNSLKVIKIEGEDTKYNQFMYWRKHYVLHDWMEKLYVSRNGKEEFNCVKIILNESDLLKLKNDVINDKLIPSDKSFFENSNDYKNYCEEIKEKDLEFIDIALSIIQDDTIVYYDSWW